MAARISATTAEVATIRPKHIRKCAQRSASVVGCGSGSHARPPCAKSSLEPKLRNGRVMTVSEGRQRIARGIDPRVSEPVARRDQAAEQGENEHPKGERGQGQDTPPLKE